MESMQRICIFLAHLSMGQKRVIFKMDRLGLGYYLEDGYLSQEVESSGLGFTDSEVKRRIPL